MTSTTTDAPAIDVHDEAIGDGGSAVAPPPPPPTPTAPTPRAPVAKPKERSILGRVTFGVMAIALGVLAAFDTSTTLVDPAPRHYLALAVTVLGIGLLVGAFAGRARWLILVGVLTLPFLFASPGLEYEFTESSAGTSFVTPTSFESLDGSIFEQSVGEMVVDLRDLPWNGEDISIQTDMGIGRTVVLIPENVTLTGSGTVSIGQVSISQVDSPNRYAAGLDAGLFFEGDGGAGLLDLTSHVGIGNLTVRRVPAES